MKISRQDPCSQHPKQAAGARSRTRLRARLSAQLLVLAVLVALAGCGNKGDLVLPSKTPPAHG
ncbi:MAG: lipoprotein [Lysobacteraceae bacterium]